MSWLFSKPKVESDSESDNESESDYDIFADPIATQKTQNGPVNYYWKSVREIAPYLHTWSFNRKIDENHKNDIITCVKLQTNPHLMGTIQVIRDCKKQCRIVNGQHRIKSILDIITNDTEMTFNMNVMFEVYDLPIDDLEDVTHIEKHNEMINQIFRIANHSLPFHADDDHNQFCKNLVQAMMADTVLQKGLRDKITKRPYMNIKELYEELKDNLKPGKTVKELIDSMKKLNVEFSKMAYKDFYGREIPSKPKMSNRKSAEEIGFYLNLDSKFTPDVWIKMLN